MKLPCPECGLPREVGYAKEHPCACCGHVGLEKKAPEKEDSAQVIAAKETLDELFLLAWEN